MTEHAAKHTCGLLKGAGTLHGRSNVDDFFLHFLLLLATFFALLH